MPGPFTALRAAASAISEDPLGVLLPAMIVLFGDLLLIHWVWLHRMLPTEALIVWLPLRAGCRAYGLRAGALALGKPARWAPIRVAIADLLRLSFSLLTAAIIIVPGIFASLWLIERRVPAIAAIALAITLMIAMVISTLVRGALWPLVAESVVGAGSFRGWWRALKAGPAQAVGAGVVGVIGDMATGFGGALCGAGALPGYFLSDLAILHRWKPL